MRSRTSTLLALGASMVLAIGVCPGLAEAETVVSYGGPFDLPIPADPGATKGWMADAIIDVSGHHVILDVDVAVSVSHTQVFDLQLLITSPSGTTIVLNMYDPFTDYFEGADYSNTVFDDEASMSISDAQPPFEGSFRPIDIKGLAAFDGEDAFGQWRLRIYDACYMDTGSLEFCELVITTPEPATVLLLLLGAGGLTRYRVRGHGLRRLGLASGGVSATGMRPSDGRFVPV
ncbi:MAG TPA: proprotein convertase P-domain-containing protein [Sedimentisphaerales bacterium]|nr:proprotein convertase P-domain-containing protein [Sedimentisphaerales bacterium]HRS13265.1 proprotein convertase P-domain-containing protein [Sedimentisphaerales bacterium]HRV49876.1 proprotein convertase P-domain-containing protein [Sedimentisphaerales bacterium]